MCTLAPYDSVIPGVAFLISLAFTKKEHRGSLGPTFVLGMFIGHSPMKHAFVLALYGGVLTHLSIPLGPDDLLSSGCRPSQTAQLMVSPFRLA